MLCIEMSARPKKFFCQYCHKGFTRKDSLDRHQNGVCKIMKLETEKQTLTIQQELVAIVQTLREEVSEIRNQPTNVHNHNHNQVLQVMCIGQNDNYLDMLTQKWDNFDRAITYIKDCALSDLVGDCKLIKKIYFDQENSQNSIFYVDKGRTRIEYFNENNERVIDHKIQFGQKLANNLQNSYLKGANYVIKNHLNGNGCPNKFLEDYDMQTWNHHIYNLSDPVYQKKFINQLDIPNKNTF
jgi:hypothetical protein